MSTAHSRFTRQPVLALVALAVLSFAAAPWLISAAEQDEKKTPAAEEGSAVTGETPEEKEKALSLAGNEAVREHILGFKGRGAVGDPNSKPLTPQESLATFTLADGLKLDMVLHEPLMRQPLHMHFDERGRMWVVQYLQYPFPAGLKVVKYDQHLRAVFDAVPQAPPNHVRGADKITIHEDTDGDGTYDKHKTFVDGLNIATSCAVGRGGVWVLNPPYLLFYPDANRDDVPDGPPEVHLRGFGLEDTHAVANSLHWGPDGWLYGAQGSTCWATISSEVTKDVHFKGQAIWRYHPETKIFEVFAEGGGNTFDVEIDAHGRVYSGTNHGARRGVHYVQGGRYIKGWGKHGPLMNPHSYGFFQHMTHEGYQPRFSHSFVLYEGGALPPEFENTLISIIPLQHRVQGSQVIREGSSFRTVDTEPLITTTDDWFRPVNVEVGPDGGVYLADWYDTRLTHVDPRDTWDREHGRIYRLRGPEFTPLAPFDLTKKTTDELIDLFAHKNRWFRQTALRVLGERQDAAALPRLRKILVEREDDQALHALWAIHLCGGWDEEIAYAALEHKNPYVRVWGIRLIGDDHKVSPGLAGRLESLAAQEENLEVRSQLACSARRLPDKAALPIVWRMASRDEDASDIHLPLLIWWALEDKALTSRLEIAERLSQPDIWKQKIVRDTIAGRVAQRYAAELGPLDQEVLVTLLRAAPDTATRRTLLAGIGAAFEGRKIPAIQPLLAKELALRSDPLDADITEVTLAIRAGDLETHDRVAELVRDGKFSNSDRQFYIELLGQMGHATALPPLLSVLSTEKQPALLQTTLQALQRFSSDRIGLEIVKHYPEFPNADVRELAVDVLSSRQDWALDLLSAVEKETIHRSTVSPEIVSRLALHKNPKIDEQIRKLWGKLRATPEERLAQMRQVASVLSSGTGDPHRGKELFSKTCAKCHRLHGEGKKIGPDLTGYERDNLDFMLLAVIDPSAAIREEYTGYQVVTVDGLILTGFLRNTTETTITFETSDKGEIVLPKEEIDFGPVAQSISIMPEKLLDEYSEQQIRDLFVYLKSPKPVK